MADDIMFLIDSTAARKPKYQEMAACCRLGRELFNKEVASTSSGYSCLPTLCGTTMFHWIDESITKKFTSMVLVEVGGVDCVGTATNDLNVASSRVPGFSPSRHLRVAYLVPAFGMCGPSVSSGGGPHYNFNTSGRRLCRRKLECIENADFVAEPFTAKRGRERSWHSNHGTPTTSAALWGCRILTASE